MDKTIRRHLDNMRSSVGQQQNQAYSCLMEQTEQPVERAHEAWDELLEGLRHKDNHVRAISAQLLVNLAQSDPHGRMLKDFEALLAVTQDGRFVTAQHCLQSLTGGHASGFDTTLRRVYSRKEWNPHPA